MGGSPQNSPGQTRSFLCPDTPGQVDQVAPGAPPLPLQVGHDSVTGKVTGTLPPSIATRNGTSTTASRVSPRVSSRRPRPKIEEKISPSPPRSPKSKFCPPKSPGDAAPALPAAEGRRGIPSNAPYRRIWSYCFRLSGSDSVLCASDTSLKRSAAFGLLGLASGWYCLASRR